MKQMSHHAYTDEELQDIISTCFCWNEVLTKLDMKTMSRSLQRRIQKSHIKCDHISKHFDGLHTKFNKFTQEQILEIIQTNTNWNDVMKLLGYQSCNHVLIIQKKLDTLKIDYSHLQLPKNAFSKSRYTLDEILVKDSTYTNMKVLKKRLKLEKGWAHRCLICGLSEWNGKSIPLEIDHIDGCNTNNTYSNLRALCPNCHAQTDTYKGKNMESCKYNTNKKTPTQTPSQPRPKLEDQTCSDCNVVINRRYTRCNTCRAKDVFESGQFRKVERPSYEQLKEDIGKMTMVRVGKKYGVSDNSIRKWLKKYEKYTLENNENTI